MKIEKKSYIYYKGKLILKPSKSARKYGVM